MESINFVMNLLKKRECTETDPIEAIAEALGTRWGLQVGK